MLWLDTVINSHDVRLLNEPGYGEGVVVDKFSVNVDLHAVKDEVPAYIVRSRRRG